MPWHRYAVLCSHSGCHHVLAVLAMLTGIAHARVLMCSFVFTWWMSQVIHSALAGEHQPDHDHGRCWLSVSHCQWHVPQQHSWSQIYPFELCHCVCVCAHMCVCVCVCMHVCVCVCVPVWMKSSFEGIILILFWNLWSIKGDWSFKELTFWCHMTVYMCDNVSVMWTKSCMYFFLWLAKIWVSEGMLKEAGGWGRGDVKDTLSGESFGFSLTMSTYRRWAVWALVQLLHGTQTCRQHSHHWCPLSWLT